MKETSRNSPQNDNLFFEGKKNHAIPFFDLNNKTKESVI